MALKGGWWLPLGSGRDFEGHKRVSGVGNGPFLDLDIAFLGENAWSCTLFFA